jgi:branched-subunit amino acid aminotransferase/4-amino-4-deoxychorismate lyase
MSDRDGKIWMDGQMVDWRDAKIHVLSHTLHYGCGAFEGVRAYKGDGGTAIFRLAEHTDRLFNSAKILRMNIPFTKEQVNAAQVAVIRENKLESGYLRPLTWIGDKKLGYDEAMLLDANGFVSEGAGENLFVVKDGVVYTPDLSAGALNGITRNTVFHICKDLGLEVVQKRITRDEVYICDEAFFTGTAAEVTPIRELDRIELGCGSRGPITEKIQSAFFDIVNGRNPKYAHWLTPV